ncbi:hypothetical protein BDZ89DRAFT_222095 [Hymenopellis radicata]|nr:hypothetical protein BDZ89DRAFT_222095 [Hymenopellis radicata]
MEQQGNRPSARPRPKQVTPPRPTRQPPAKPEPTTDGMAIDNEAFSTPPTTPIRSTTRALSRQRVTPLPSQASRNIHIGDPVRDGWTKEDYEKAYLRTTDLLISQENINLELGEQKRRFYADWKDKQEANKIRIVTLENNNSALVDEIEVLKRTNQDLRDEIKSLKQTMVDKDTEARNEKLHYTENTLNELKKHLQTHTRQVDNDRSQVDAIVIDDDEIVSPAIMLWRNKYNNEVALKRERRHRLFNDLRQIDLLYGQLQKSIQKRKVTACELRRTIQGHLEDLSRWVTVLNRAEGFR